MLEKLRKRRAEERTMRLLEEFDREAKALPAICGRLERAFFETKEERAKKDSLISAQYSLERLMRCADELSWLTKGKDPAEYPAQIRCPTESYSVTGNRDEGFKIHMPPLQKRGPRERPHPQKVKAESVRAAALSYLGKQGLRKCLYGKCTLTYTVMIGPEAGDNIGDAENLDTKQITDALTGIFFPDDNLTHVRIVVQGEFTERPSYTVLTIKAEETAENCTEAAENATAKTEPFQKDADSYAAREYPAPRSKNKTRSEEGYGSFPKEKGRDIQGKERNKY